MEPLIVALPKGRMENQAADLFGAVGYPLDHEAAAGRKLVFEDTTGRLRFILAKPADVPTYVE